MGSKKLSYPENSTASLTELKNTSFLPDWFLFRCVSFVELQLVILPCLILSQGNGRTQQKCENHNGRRSFEQTAVLLTIFPFRDAHSEWSPSFYASWVWGWCLLCIQAVFAFVLEGVQCVCNNACAHGLCVCMICVHVCGGRVTGKVYLS